MPSLVVITRPRKYILQNPYAKLCWKKYKFLLRLSLMEHADCGISLNSNRLNKQWMRTNESIKLAIIETRNVYHFRISINEKEIETEKKCMPLWNILATTTNNNHNKGEMWTLLDIVGFFVIQSSPLSGSLSISLSLSLFPCFYHRFYLNVDNNCRCWLNAPRLAQWWLDGYAGIVMIYLSCLCFVEKIEWMSEWVR